MRKIILSFLICTFAFADKYDGYYFGVLPCENCEGIATWLKLDGKKYEMREKFLGVKNRYSNGEIVFYDNATIGLKPFENKIFKIGFDYLKPDSFQGVTLKKVQAFKESQKVLLVDESKMTDGKSNGEKIVNFVGITNYQLPSQYGYKSKKASYFLRCSGKTYELSRVSFYKKRYGLGGFVNSPENTRQKFDITQNPLVYLAYKKYCF